MLESLGPSGVHGADVEPEDIVAHLPSALAAYSNAHGALPSIVVVPGLGLFTAGDTYQQADMIRQVYLDAIEVSIGAHQLGGVGRSPRTSARSSSVGRPSSIVAESCRAPPCPGGLVA